MTARAALFKASPAARVAVLLGVSGCQAPQILAVDCAPPGECSGSPPCAGVECADGGGPVPEAPVAARLLVDDFEDANELVASGFDVWMAHTYNPGGQYARLLVEEPGHDSLAALYLDWRVQDMPDGQQEFPGAGVETHALNTPVDLTAYSVFSFSQRFERGESTGGTGECTTEPLVTVILECDNYPGAPALDASGRPPGYEGQVRLSETWATARVSFDELHEPTWRPPTGVPLAGCLSATTALYFQLQTGLADGQCAAGRLALDTIELF